MLNSVSTLPNRVSAFDTNIELIQSSQILPNFNSTNTTEKEIDLQNYCKNYAHQYAAKYFEDHVDNYVYDNYDNNCKTNLDYISDISEKSTIIPSLNDQHSLIQYDKAAFFKSGQMTNNVSFNGCQE